jgi:hypothetical protein
MSAPGPESQASIILSLAVVIAFVIAIILTKPTCRPDEYAALLRGGWWVCARTP